MYKPAKRKAVTAIPPMPFEMYLRARACKRLAGWMFRGKCARSPAKCRLKASAAYQAEYGNGSYLNTAAGLRELAQEVGPDPTRLTVSWIARDPAVAAAILWAGALQRFEPPRKALEIKMALKPSERRLARRSPEAAPAHGRTEEQR
jgi:aryl-alcohol dehydrogenase-like predicted oxidoreductase